MSGRFLLVQQVSELRQQFVFLLPRRVHQATNVLGLPSDAQPPSYVVQIIRIVVTGRERLKSLVGEELQVLCPRCTTPDRNDQVLGHVVP